MRLEPLLIFKTIAQFILQAPLFQLFFDIPKSVSAIGRRFFVRFDLTTLNSRSHTGWQIVNKLVAKIQFIHSITYICYSDKS